MRYLTRISVVLLAIVFAGCELLGIGDVPIDDDAPYNAVEDGLELLLEAPEEVSQHEPIEVRYHVINHRGGDVHFTTAHSCLSWMSAHRDDERAELRGLNHGCAAAITDHNLAAGDTLTQTLNGRAEWSDSEEAAEPGSYLIRAESDIIEIEGSEVEIPTVQRSFEVIE